MTTIAWDGRYLAGDGLSTCDDTPRGYKCRKIGLVLPDLKPRTWWSVGDATGTAVLHGGTGTRHQLEQYQRWMARVGGDEEAEWPFPTDKDLWNTEMLEVRVGLTRSYSGEITSKLLSVLGREWAGNLTEMGDPGATGPTALGNGRDFAEGAMAAGRNAMEAVAIAAKLDVYTGGQITFIDTEDVLRGVQIHGTL